MDLFGPVLVGAGAVAGWLAWRRFADWEPKGDSAGAGVARAGTDAADKAARFVEDAGEKVTGVVARGVGTAGEVSAKSVGYTVDAAESLATSVIPGLGDDDAAPTTAKKEPAKKPAPKKTKASTAKKGTTAKKKASTGAKKPTKAAG